MLTQLSGLEWQLPYQDTIFCNCLTFSIHYWLVQLIIWTCYIQHYACSKSKKTRFFQDFPINSEAFISDLKENIEEYYDICLFTVCIINE